LGWHEQWLVSSRRQRGKCTRDDLSVRARRRLRGCQRCWSKQQRRGKVVTEVGRWMVASCWCWPEAIYSRWCVWLLGTGVSPDARGSTIPLIILGSSVVDDYGVLTVTWLLRGFSSRLVCKYASTLQAKVCVQSAVYTDCRVRYLMSDIGKTFVDY
jgi:hypothetical protein